MTICNCLREVRLKLGYRQEEISEITNISQQYISSVKIGFCTKS